MSSGLQTNSAVARASNCSTVEAAYGMNLDALAHDQFLELLGEFAYSKADDQARRPAKHRVPIDGNLHSGTATLKSALTKYFKFRFDPDTDRHQPKPPGPPKPGKPTSDEWPEWEPPSEEDSLQLAHVLTRHARFLNPEIVSRIAEDNDRRSALWGARLGELGIATDAYLWSRSSCAFPGVRRYAGSAEIAGFRGHKLGGGKLPPGAVALDDNDYPKHLWSFIFRGKPFQKQGPRGYNLAHIVDHKDHGNRASEHFELAPGVVPEGRLYGLFTCPTNTVFVPLGLLKPTDFHPKVRGLFIRKAQALYGSICNIVPPFMSLRACSDSSWSIDCFKWADPVGETRWVDDFLMFRNERMDQLLASTVARPSLGPFTDVSATAAGVSRS